MDPMSAIAIAGTAFSAIKQGFEHGREIEGMMGDMARWMGAIKDVKEGANKAKAKKKYGSIEEEAFEEFAALKEAERMENELRQFVNMNYGPQSWAQIVKLQADIRIREQQARLNKQNVSVKSNRTFVYLGWCHISSNTFYIHDSSCL
jgi:hypothetical protein